MNLPVFSPQRTVDGARRRALFLINGEHYAGAERVQDLLACQLPAFGWTVDFACLKPGAFATSRESRDSQVFELPMRSRVDLRQVGQVAALLGRGYDVLHTHTVRSAMIGAVAARRAGKPMVHHVHGRTDRNTESPWRDRVNSGIERLSLGQARRLIAVSAHTADHLRRRGHPEASIRTIPNGVPCLPQAAAWQPPAGEWVIGMAALFRPLKGLDVLIEAMAQLHARGLPVRLRAIGAFENEAYQQQVLAAVRARGLEGHVHWTGFTRQVLHEMAKTHVVVLPSLYGEGLPMVVIEAMAAGLPVVASASEGIHEALDEGRAGMLVQPADATALADALAALITDPERTRALACVGLARQRQHYSDVSMARQVAQVYGEVCPDASSPAALIRECHP
ncbi:MAG TPA: glycosyltransferase [Stenotrophomonas sp.]|jgi:glycosyltransferase involved in cell wall biosynthesis